jgi:hypothetical protein
MSPLDASMVLVNKTNLDSGTDGVGSGADPTVTGGALINLEEEADLAAVLFVIPSATGGEPGDADTLDVIIECAPDGTNFGRLCTFRRVLGSEAPDDVAAGDKTVRLAIPFRLPRSTVAGVRTVPVRANTTASDTSDWGVYIAITDRGSVRSEWMANAIEA